MNDHARHASHPPASDDLAASGTVPIELDDETVGPQGTSGRDQSSPLDREHLDLGDRTIDVGSP